MLRGLFLSGQPRPHRKRAGPSDAQLSIYAYALCRRTTKFDVIKHTGNELVSSITHTPSQGGNVEALHKYEFPSVYTYTLSH